MDQSQEVHFDGKPSLSVKVPQRSLGPDEIMELVTRVVKLAQGKWLEETEEVVEEAVKKAVKKAVRKAVEDAVAKCQEELKSREKKIRKESYLRGRAAALIICNSSIRETSAKYSAVKGQPGIPDNQRRTCLSHTTRCRKQDSMDPTQIRKPSKASR